MLVYGLPDFDRKSATQLDKPVAAAVFASKTIEPYRDGQTEEKSYEIT